MNASPDDRGTTNVVQVPVERILDLRRAVLRTGTTSSDPNYTEDELDGTVHLAVERDGNVIAASTWLPRPTPSAPDEPAFQLKGMAVADHLQGEGIGTILLDAGIARAAAAGARLVWARARDSALGFYLRHGFVVVGEAFIDDITGLSHHVVERRVD